MLSTVSLFSLVLGVMICVFYNYLGSYEEKLLESKFADKYRIYKENTGKWLPRFQGKKPWSRGRLRLMLALFCCSS